MGRGCPLCRPQYHGCACQGHEDGRGSSCFAASPSLPPNLMWPLQLGQLGRGWRQGGVFSKGGSSCSLLGVVRSPVPAAMAAAWSVQLGWQLGICGGGLGRKLPMGAAKRGRSEWGRCGVPLMPHSVPSPGSPWPGWVPVVQDTPLLGQGDASRSLAVAVGLSLQRAGHGVGVAGQGVPLRGAGLPCSRGCSPGSLFVALGRGLAVLVGTSSREATPWGCAGGRAGVLCWGELCRGAVPAMCVLAVGCAVGCVLWPSRGAVPWVRAVPEQIVGPMAVFSPLSPPPGHAALPPILPCCHRSILSSGHPPAPLSVLPPIPPSSRPGAPVPRPCRGCAEQGLTHLFALSLSVRPSVCLSLGRSSALSFHKDS